MNAIVPAHDLEQVEKADRLFRSFFGRAPNDREIINLTFPASPQTCLVIGEVDGLMYRTKYDSKPFFHRMGEKTGNRPLLVVTADGDQFYALKGAYKFTKRGFED
jgi:hypothetical protein